jgi:ABC-type transport system substrate-binding protein/class 3 adenylate cyclase
MAVATGERRIVSVLIADLVGSTKIGERLGPERTKILIDEVHRIMAEQVRRYDGTVAQLRGDELYAIWGAPVAHEDDSERTVRSALALQRAVGRYAEEVKAAYDVELAVRVGINTGPVVVRPDEDGDGTDPWNALGDTVNVASRLQNLAPPGGVVLGSTTARQVESCFLLEELGEQELRGRETPVQTFQVTGIRDPEPLSPGRPLVGRDFELTVLERTADGLVEGRGVIASIMGEPGIGKTRLMAEVRSRYHDRIRFVEGRGVSYAQTFPYWPIRDLLREWLAVGAATPEARVRLELKAQLAELFEDADEVYPFFATLMGLTLEPDAAQRIRELNREGVQSQTFEYFSDLLVRLSEEMPLGLVVEDLHWADDATLELLEALLPVTEEAAVGLFFLFRSERQLRSWQLGERARQLYPHRYREIELRPLPTDASRTLVAEAAEGEIPEDVAELLAERAGGNPFFLEEAFRDLVERGAIRRRNGAWELGVELDELAIPALVQGALQARLDRLEPKTREVLLLAAVVGRTFGTQLLERLVPHEELLQSLSELQRLDLVVEKRRRPVREYRFRHGLLQEVAYANLVESKRRKLHRLVGEALLDLHRDSQEEVYALLARHFSEADDPERAVEYLLKAGDAARALYADQEALDHYAKARNFLARVGDERRTRDTLFKMALAHHLAFNFAAAEELYDEAFSCRVEEVPAPAPTETIETAAGKPADLVPGQVYTTEGIYFTQHLFRGLLMIDGELNVIPAMADNFRVSSDGLTYLFRLREDGRWSDGEPLTASDYAFAWQQMQERGLLTAFLLEDVETAEALDERTLEIRLREPRNYFPYILASAWSFPWPQHKCEELGDEWRKPENLVGNGPFMLSEFDSEHAVLVANPHWRGARGNVKEVRFDFVSRSLAAAEKWREGRFDFLPTYTAFHRQLADAENTVTELVPELWLQYVGFRANRPPFSNVLVRRAFAHAIDRDRLIADVGTLNRPATRGGSIPPAMPGHSHRIGLEFDLARARALLEQAGYPDGRGFPELTVLVPKHGRYFEALQEQLAALGVRIQEAEPTPGRPKPSHISEEHHLWLSGWSADYPDPDGMFRGFMRLDWPFYCDEEVDELLDRARSAGDQSERLRLYHELDRLWVNEHAAIVPVAYGRAMVVRRPWVKGVWVNPLQRAHLDQVVVERHESGSLF